MSLWVQESYENATEEHQVGETDVYETAFDDVGKLYKAMQRAWGRCTGKVYIDRREPPDAKLTAVAVGWTFERTSRYEDTLEPYKSRVWITVHERPPVKRTYYHYKEV